MNISSIPLFPPFWSGTDLSQRCSHILSEKIYPISPETTTSGDGTASDAGSGVWGPPEQTPSADQEHTDCKGSGISRCYHWGPLALRDPGTGSMPGPPPGQVTTTGWRGVGTSWRAWSISRRRRSCNSPHLACGSASTLRSSPGAGLWQPGPLPSILIQNPWWSPENTPRCIPTCCGSKPGQWYCSQSESWPRIHRSVPPGWTALNQIPGHRGCGRFLGITPGGTASCGAVSAPLCEGGPLHDI